MKIIRFLLILLICLNLLKVPVLCQESKIIGLDVLASDKQALNYLNEKGFVAKPPFSKQIYLPYLTHTLPAYVTADSLLQTYYIIYREASIKLIAITNAKFLMLMELLQEKILAGLSINPNEKTKLAIEKTVEKLQLLTVLLENQENLPNLVKSELELINCADSIEISPLLGVEIDYKVFQIPNNIDSNQAKLFQLLTWLEHWQVVLSDDLAAEQTLLLALEFGSDERLLRLWQEIDLSLNYLIGSRKGVTLFELIPTIDYIFGDDSIAVNEISKVHIKTFQRLSERINSTKEPIKLFGERISLAQELKDVFGTEILLKLDFASLYNTQNLEDKKLKVLKQILSWQEKNPNSHYTHLVNWFRSLLTTNKDGRLPKFVNSPAWQDRLSTTVSVSWFTYQQPLIAPTKSSATSHNSNLYRQDFHGYVEPNKAFFAAVLQMANSLQDVLLKNRIFISEVDKFIDVNKLLLRIVEKQLSAISLSEDEIDLLENYGETLAELSFVLSNYESKEFDQTFNLKIKSETSNYQIIAGQVLNLYLVVTYQDKQYLCQGAITNYCTSDNQRNIIKPLAVITENTIMPYQQSYISTTTAE